jgi:hypothetical protein
MPVEKLKKSGLSRNSYIGVILASLGFLIIMAIEFFMVSYGYGYWIELFNGATWPQQFTQMSPASNNPFIFYVILSLRTAINLGAGLTLIAGAYWFFANGPERWLMRKLSSVLNVRDTALTGYLIQVLEKENIKLPEQVEDMLYKAAEEFQSTDAGRHFLREAQRSNNSDQK